MSPNKRTLAVRLLLLAACCMPLIVKAAMITWATGPHYNGPNGFNAILTNGSLVEAINLDNLLVGDRTVDPVGINVTFVPDPSKLPQSIFSSGSPGTNDSNWNSIVNDTDWSSNDGVIIDFFTGLTVGDRYQVQLFASDIRSCCASRVQFFSDGLGNISPSFTQSTFTSIVGTFTADAAGQALGLFASPGSDPILEAYVLLNTTNTTIPEPATLALFGFGLAGFGVAFRRRTLAI